MLTEVLKMDPFYVPILTEEYRAAELALLATPL
jgi:hypothetical protein